jgi:salicylate hydroxylase
MGLGEEYNSVAETDDSGLFFQWWDGLKVYKGGEVSPSAQPRSPILINPAIQTYTKYPRSAVHRARLLEVLHGSLPESVIVHLGVRVTGVKNLASEGKARITYTASQPPPGSTPTLPAGAALAQAPTTPKEEHFDADVVVGADGIKSVLRSIIAVPAPPEAGKEAGKPAAQRYTGTYCYRALVPMEKAMELDVPEMGIYAQKPKMVFGNGRHLTIFPIEKGKVSFES